VLGDLPAYDARVATSHQALADAPAHWRVAPMRSLIRRRSERNRADLPLLTVARERGVFVRRDDDGNHNAIPEDLSNYKIARQGDLVINKMKAWQGSLGLAPVDGIVSPAYFVFDFSIDNRAFGQYLLRSKPYVGLMAAASDGVRIGQWDLVTDRFRALPVLIPPTEEQAAIVTYLGHAHARIDRVIAAKRRLIALLEEQKRAELSAMITASGVETDNRWFPRLKPGWRAVTLARVLFRAVDGPHFSPPYVDEGVPFLSARNIRAGKWVFEDMKFVSHDLADEFDRRIQPAVGDVLYTKGGTTGVAKAVDWDKRFQVWVHIAVLKLRPELVRPEFLEIMLNSQECYVQSQLETRGATNQDLGLSRMKRITIPLAPYDEQASFVQQVGAQSQRIDEAIDHARREIELLREFRSRLTADVVTGQVDVREVAATLPRLDPNEMPADVGEQDEDDVDDDLDPAEEA
tara:strand:+ start:346 stop:1731 length:1386 start_codon:yes stop_codon:yes gene_type:complete